MKSKPNKEVNTLPVKPISPKEVAGSKKQSMPDAVLESFNEMIKENEDDGYAIFLQKEVVKRMKKKGLKEKDIFDKGYLNVETIYRKEGWNVEYDNPGYCESYDSSFTFSRKSKK